MKAFKLFFVVVFTFSFLSDGFAQDIEEILEAQEIDTMLYSGPKDNRINWVIQNRGSSFQSREEFVELYQEDLLKTFELGQVKEQAPYAQYRNFFNLYTSWWPEALDDDTGWSWSIIKGLRDMLFLPWANNETGWVTWFSTTRHGGGGGAGLERDRRVGDGKMFGMGHETFLHEFGHTMPGQLDEYSSDGSWSNGQCWETPNTSGGSNIDEIPWRLWIEEGTPIPTPYTEEYLDRYGAFEGAMTNFFGCYRPSARSCFMGAGGFGEDYGTTLCSPCKQRIICYLYRYVNVIENPSPDETNIEINGPETMDFRVELISPEPNTQKTAWILNGKTIATNTDEVSVSFDMCTDYELKFTVLDTNTLVRYDPKFEHIYPRPYREQIWYISNNEVINYDLNFTQSIISSDCSGEASGMISLDIAGGSAPYLVYSNGINAASELTGLSPGSYHIEVVDNNGCSVDRLIEVPQDILLSPVICSEYDGNSWILSVEDENYDSSDLNYSWSIGETTQSISINSSGSYSVDVSTANGCIVRSEIEINIEANPLEVVHTYFNSEANKPTGKIYLDPSGGVPFYKIKWEDKTVRDLASDNIDNIIYSGTTWDHYPEYAFDDDLTTKWLHAISTDAFIGYRFNEPTVINSYAITSADDVPERDPRNWQLQGSNDGSNWVILDAQENHEFNSRYERRGFLFQNDEGYLFYRLYILENYGDIATQIQELEFVGVNNSIDYEPKPEFDDQLYRDELAAGSYRYTLKDRNGVFVSEELTISMNELIVFDKIEVEVLDNCSIQLIDPKPNHQYYWFSDASLSSILGVGESYTPSVSGNYYIGYVDEATNLLSNTVRGFAVTVEEQPDVFQNEMGDLEVIDPDTDNLEYRWYDSENCGQAVHVGTTFSPEDEGQYYISSHRIVEDIESIDPLDIDGMLIRMDASDLDGDSQQDIPLPETSSLYDWNFTPNNGWSSGSWFAYRSNYQNGLGVVDFATIWLQALREGVRDYQTIIMAYEENPISFENRAPFEGLSRDIPRHIDESQLYADNTPSRTLDGLTLLNGETVDPLATANPLSFCVLATSMTEQSDSEVFYTDTHWEGKIGELLLYDRALTEEELKGISQYLKEKWIELGSLDSPKKAFYWDGSLLNVEPLDKKDLRVYPNPASEIIQIEVSCETFDLAIFDQEGKIVRRKSMSKEIDRVFINDLNSGIYFIQISCEDGRRVFVRPFIKQ